MKGRPFLIPKSLFVKMFDIVIDGFFETLFPWIFGVEAKGRESTDV